MQSIHLSLKLTSVAQYANLYFIRLALLKPVLIERASFQWSSHASQTERVLDVTQGELTWIVGTVYLDMPLKPQVLQDLVSDVNLSAAVPQRSWRDTRYDTIQLEDESGRISLVGHKLSDQLLCTGIVVAVLGSETTSEEFNVIDIILPDTVEPFAEIGSEDTPATSISSDVEESMNESERKHSEDSRIAFVSGFDFNGLETPSPALDLLQELLTGELLNRNDQLLMSAISCLVVVGNSLQAETPALDDAMARKINKNRKYGYDSASFNPRPIGALDDFLSEVCKTINVVLLPGDQDPTNSTLPQQAINPIMLRKGSRYSSTSLKLTTNPAYLQIADRTIFCTSGQTIDNIAHYVPTPIYNDTQQEENLSSLDIAEHTLKWRHSAPTAPDTLWTYPYADQDPFVFEKYPDIYIVGNQAAFEHRFVQIIGQSDMGDPISSKCLLLSLPRFSQSGQIVLVNSRNLTCEVLNFPGYD